LYGCVSDADCGFGEACNCGTAIGGCVPAGCRSDASCAAGFACLSWQGDDCTGYEPSCETAADACRTSADCATDRVCQVREGRRVCGQRGRGCISELN
jgi:Cys-rich repeat protein